MDTLCDKIRDQQVCDLGDPLHLRRIGCASHLSDGGPRRTLDVRRRRAASPVRGDLELRSEVITPANESYFVHGASSIETPAGLLAFWYRAVYEGANNAELVSSRFDGQHWSPTTVVTNSKTVSHDVGLTIKSLANPVPFRRSPDEIWLFFSASRLSGWDTCEIMMIRSLDNGRTWGPAQRLYASPFLNMSHLTKALPIRLSGDRIALPAYYEMLPKYPVMLVLNKDGRVIDRRRMGNGGQVGFQPSIVATGPKTAIAFIRRLKHSRPHRILISRTNDAGRTWTVPEPTSFPNPGGPIAAIRYDSTRILLAFNDDPEEERNIKLAFSNLDGTKLHRIGTLVQMKDDVPETRSLTVSHRVRDRPIRCCLFPAKEGDWSCARLERLAGT